MSALACCFPASGRRLLFCFFCKQFRSKEITQEDEEAESNQELTEWGEQRIIIEFLHLSHRRVENSIEVMILPGSGHWTPLISLSIA